MSKAIADIFSHVTRSSAVHGPASGNFWIGAWISGSSGPLPPPLFFTPSFSGSPLESSIGFVPGPESAGRTSRSSRSRDIERRMNQFGRGYARFENLQPQPFVERADFDAKPARQP